MPADPAYMRLAIEVARQGVRDGQHPYGAAIIRAGQVIACVHNVVSVETDPSAHAEVNCIRTACRQLGTTDLAGCEIYCTCEPCAMCFAACHWANVDTIIYGASILDKDPFGLFDIGPRAADLLTMMRRPATLVPEFLRHECVDLFREFKSRGGVQ